MKLLADLILNSEYNENFQNEYLENHINECVCSGCANSEIQYMERARLNYLWFSKMVETREAMASQFNEVSKIVEKFLRPAISEDLLTDRMAEKIQRKFREKKIYAKKIRVVKNEKEYIEVEFYAKKRVDQKGVEQRSRQSENGRRATQQERKRTAFERQD